MEQSTNQSTASSIKLVDWGKRFNKDHSKVTRPFTIMVDLINNYIDLLNSEDSCSELHTSETSLSLLDYIYRLEIMVEQHTSNQLVCICVLKLRGYT